MNGKQPSSETKSVEVVESLPLSDNPPNTKPLNPRQKKFLKNMLDESMCPTDAYMDAYKPKIRRTALSGASDLIRTNPYIQQAIQEAKELQEEQTKQVLLNKVLDAAERLGELIDSEDENVAFRASKEILYMAGHKPKDEVEHSGQQIVIINDLKGS